MAEQERTGIADEREAGGVAFGKAVLPESLNLLEHPSGELGGDSLGAHAGKQAAPVPFHPSRAPPGGHVAAELVGFAGGVVGSDHREPHDLFLEQRHSQGLFQDGPERGVRVFHRLFTPAAAKVGVHHAAGDGPGPNDAHFDHQVVVVLGLEPRQHGHLRPALDLENPNGCRLPDHCEGCGVVGGDGGHGQIDVSGLLEQPESEVQLGKGAEPQQIHLEKAQFLDVVLVPLNDRSSFHRGVFHRHDVRDRLLSEEEAAGMDREVPGKSLDFVRQPEKVPGRRPLRRPAGSGEAVAGERLVVGERAGQPVHGALRKPERLAHVPDRGPRPVADGIRHHGGAPLAVPPIHELDDLLPARMHDVQVDVGRFGALAGQEPLEQEPHPDRIHRGDAEAEADRRVRRGTPPLTEDFPLAAEADDLDHGEEITAVVEFVDQLEFLFQLLSDGGRNAVGITLGGACEGQFPESLIRVHPSGKFFGGIAIAEFVKREAAGLRRFPGSGRPRPGRRRKVPGRGQGSAGSARRSREGAVRLPEAAPRNGWR